MVCWYLLVSVAFWSAITVCLKILEKPIDGPQTKFNKPTSVIVSLLISSYIPNAVSCIRVSEFEQPEMPVDKIDSFFPWLLLVQSAKSELLRRMTQFHRFTVVIFVVWNIFRP